jgi:hypothetical protein
MALAEGQLSLAGFGERPIAGIAIDLQDTPDALEMSDRTPCSRSYNSHQPGTPSRRLERRAD